MKYNPEKHHRRSIRLKNYDYSQPGAYFVTICNRRQQLFGKVVHGKVKRSDYRKIVWNEWFRSTQLRQEMELYDNEFVVMPNHIQGIVWITHRGAPLPHKTM